MAVKCHWKLSPAASVVARPSNKLSVFVGLAGSFSSSGPGESPPRSPTQRSPRSFAYDGAVGLGIVAAMNDVPSPAAGEYGPVAVGRTPRTAAAPRSEPIPIVSARPTTGVPRKQYYWSEEEDMQLSESYTCVISQVGGEAVRKRVYLDVDGAGDNWGGWFEVFYGSPPPACWPEPLPVLDFLSRCFRCSKKLHGLDIFMYRGDKAFCSEECRCQQMISDEHREKRISDTLKPFDCSLSPCSTPLRSGVAAA